MANTVTIAIRVAGMAEAKRDFDQINKGLNSVADTASQVGTKLSILGAGILGATGMFAKAAISAAASMEQQRVAYGTLLKSGEAATKVMKDLYHFAAVTPFEFPDVASWGKALLAAGFSANQLIPVITQMGDAISVTGGSTEAFTRTIHSMAQMIGRGKASMMEIREISLNLPGFPVMKVLQKAFGMNGEDLGKAIEQGKISGAAVAKALIEGMGKFGKGGMEAQSKTIIGVISTLKDTWRSFLTNVEGTGVGDQMAKTILPGLKRILAGMDALAKDGTFAKWGQSLGKLFADIGQKFLNLAQFFLNHPGITAATVKFVLLTGVITAVLGPAAMLLSMGLKLAASFRAWQAAAQAATVATQAKTAATAKAATADAAEATAATAAATASSAEAAASTAEAAADTASAAASQAAAVANAEEAGAASATMYAYTAKAGVLSRLGGWFSKVGGTMGAWIGRLMGARGAAMAAGEANAALAGSIQAIGFRALGIVGAILAMKAAWDNNFLGMQDTYVKFRGWLQEHPLLVKWSDAVFSPNLAPVMARQERERLQQLQSQLSAQDKLYGLDQIADSKALEYVRRRIRPKGARGGSTIGSANPRRNYDARLDAEAPDNPVYRDEEGNTVQTDVGLLREKRVRYEQWRVRKALKEYEALQTQAAGKGTKDILDKIGGESTEFKLGDGKDKKKKAKEEGSEIGAELGKAMGQLMESNFDAGIKGCVRLVKTGMRKVGLEVPKTETAVDFMAWLKKQPGVSTIQNRSDFQRGDIVGTVYGKGATATGHVGVVSRVDKKGNVFMIDDRGRRGVPGDTVAREHVVPKGYMAFRYSSGSQVESVLDTYEDDRKARQQHQENLARNRAQLARMREEQRLADLDAQAESPYEKLHARNERLRSEASDRIQQIRQLHLPDVEEAKGVFGELEALRGRLSKSYLQYIKDEQDAQAGADRRAKEDADKRNQEAEEHLRRIQQERDALLDLRQTLVDSRLDAAREKGTITDEDIQAVKDYQAQWLALHATELSFWETLAAIAGFERQLTGIKKEQADLEKRKQIDAQQDRVAVVQDEIDNTDDQWRRLALVKVRIEEERKLLELEGKEPTASQVHRWNREIQQNDPRWREEQRYQKAREDLARRTDEDIVQSFSSRFVGVLFGKTKNFWKQWWDDLRNIAQNAMEGIVNNYLLNVLNRAKNGKGPEGEQGGVWDEKTPVPTGGGIGGVLAKVLGLPEPGEPGKDTLTINARTVIVNGQKGPSGALGQSLGLGIVGGPGSGQGSTFPGQGGGAPGQGAGGFGSIGQLPLGKSNVGGVFTAAMLGYALAPLLFGKNSYSNVGGGLGAGIGMALGGPVGGLIGGLIGGALGGLFKKHKPKPDQGHLGYMEDTWAGRQLGAQAMEKAPNPALLATTDFHNPRPAWALSYPVPHGAAGQDRNVKTDASTRNTKLEYHVHNYTNKQLDGYDKDFANRAKRTLR